MRRSSAFLCASWAVWLVAAPARADLGWFWEPHPPDARTLALFRFDGSLDDVSAASNRASLAGAAALVPDGKFGGALRLTGGSLTLSLTQPLSGFVLELWVNPDRLPPEGKAAVLLDRGYEPPAKRWAQWLLLPDGALLWKHSRERGRFGHGDSYALSYPGVITTGRWQHVTLVNSGTQESMASRLFLNGRNVTAPPYGNYLACEPDDPPSTLTVGAKEAGTANREWWYNAETNRFERIRYRAEAFVPYEGRLDELRITSGHLEVVPLPDTSFCDPEKTRSLPDDPRCTPSADDLLFHASFDQGLDADAARGVPAGGKPQAMARIPGVRGQALALTGEPGGYVRYATAGNFVAMAGTVSLWVRPHVALHWPGTMFNASPCYFTPFILVRNCYHFHAPLYPTLERLPVGQWAHVAWVWNRHFAAFYVNGEKACDVPLNTPAPITVEPHMTLGMQDPADFDELRIYRRPLSAEEVRNEYQRYLPGPRLEPLGDLGVAFVDFRSANTLAGSVFSRRGPLPGAAGLTLALAAEGKTAARLSVPAGAAEDTPFVWALPDRVAGGLFAVAAAAHDASGKPVAGGGGGWRRKEYPWLGNRIGCEDRVLHPWTPVQVRGGRALGVIGRTFTLGRDGLFERVGCWGDDLLAAPMRVEAEAGKGPVAAIGRGARVTRRTEPHVAWEAESRLATGSGTGLTLRVAAHMDYDGTTRFELTMDPGRVPVAVRRLSLVVPVRRPYAELHTWNVGGFLAEPRGAERQTADVPWECTLPAGDGEIFSSLREYERSWPGNMVRRGLRIPTVGNFMPQVWFGNNEGGVSLFADSDRGWVPDDRAPAIQVVARGQTAEIRLNFVAAPFTIGKPRTVVFGFLPTPVKPLPADWRTGRYFGEFGTPWGSGTSFVADYEDGRADISGMKAAVESRRAQGLPSTPHLNTVFFDPGRETRREFSADWHDGYAFAPYAMLSRSKVDYMVWTMQRWKQDCGIDGMYFDCATPEPNLNTISGTAYPLEDGRIQTGWTIWNERDLFRRASCVFGDLYRGNLLWGNGFYGPEISGWQSATVVGEGCEVFTRDNRELVGRHHVSLRDFWGYLPLRYYSDTIIGNFGVERVHAVSHPWGLIRLWQGPHMLFWAHPESANDPPDLVDRVKAFARSANAQLMVLDTRGAFAPLFPQYYLDFVARPGLRVHGFWNNHAAVSRTPADMPVTAYVAGNDILFVASNLTTNRLRPTVTLDPRALGMAADVAALQVVDMEGDATWGTTANEIYWKYLWSGPPLLPDAERAVQVSPGAGTLDIIFTVGPKDYRAFRVSAQPAGESPPEK